MGKMVKKVTAVLLAVALLVGGSTMLYRADGGKGGQAQMETALASGSSPLRVEVTANKDKYSIYGKPDVSVTVTNISKETVKNVSVEAWGDKGQYSAEKQALAPNESISLKYKGHLEWAVNANELGFFDVLLLWIPQFFHNFGTKNPIHNFDNGRSCVEESKSIQFNGFFTKYEGQLVVNVWYGNGGNTKVQQVLTTTEKIKEKYNQVKSSNISRTKQLLYDYLLELQKSGEISNVEIDSNNQNLLTFRYSNGTLGGWTVDEFSDLEFSPSRSALEEVSYGNINGEQLNSITPQASNQLTNRKAIILSSFSESAKEDAGYEELQKRLIWGGYEVKYIYNASVVSYKSINDYGIIAIVSHGYTYKGFPVICLEEKMTESSLNAYANELEREFVTIVNEKYWILPTFFIYYYKTIAGRSLSESLIHISLCYGYSNNGLAAAFASAGASTVLGYTNSVRIAYDYDILLSTFDRLLAGDSADIARLYAISQYGEPDDQTTPAYYRLYGDPDKRLNDDIYGQVSGNVKSDTTNTWLVGVTVEAYGYSDNKPYGTATTDSGGLFQLTLPEGKYSLRLSYPTSDTNNVYRQSSVTVDVKRGVLFFFLDPIIMIKYNNGITGKVLDKDTNQPIEGVTVTAYKMNTTETVGSATTNASGEYALALDSGEYDLTFGKAGYTTQKKNWVTVYIGVASVGDILLQSDGTGGAFAGGNGTATSPYLVSTPAQLDAVRNNMTAHYKMINNIDLASWGNWVPIGTYETYSNFNPFKGTFDGDGFTICNLSIDISSDKRYGGLFGYVIGGNIENLGIVNLNITAVTNASIYVGSIVGVAGDISIISNCYSTGNIVSSSSSALETFTSIGGIAGGLASSQINNCYSFINIRSSVSDCIQHRVGGIAGDISYSAVRNCYYIGSLNASSSIYTPHIGGILGGTKSSKISNCYYSNTIPDGIGSRIDQPTYDISNLIPIAAFQMKEQASFIGFDFINTWAINPAINNGYPYLRGMHSTDDTFAGGNGTASSPYLVSTPAQLNAVRNDLAAHYKMINDIDLASWGNWVPIGDYDLLFGDGNATKKQFSGVFDGNGYTVKNITISSTTQETVGLFGAMKGGAIKNLSVYGNINCSFATNVSAGGIVGYAYSSAIISNCYSANTIDVSAYVVDGGGGIFWPALGATTYAGGIVGLAHGTTISNCYNTGNVNSTAFNFAYAGGIIGYSNATISNCYNIGLISSSSPNTKDSGGIAGQIGTLAVTRQCYYLNNSSSAIPGKSDSMFTDVRALTSSQMKQQSSFTGFDFTNTWAIDPAINNGYPYLRGMQP